MIRFYTQMASLNREMEQLVLGNIIENFYRF